LGGGPPPPHTQMYSLAQLAPRALASARALPQLAPLATRALATAPLGATAAYPRTPAGPLHGREQAMEAAYANAETARLLQGLKNLTPEPSQEHERAKEAQLELVLARLGVEASVPIKKALLAWRACPLLGALYANPHPHAHPALSPLPIKKQRNPLRFVLCTVCKPFSKRRALGSWRGLTLTAGASEPH
jgi:hypothetical protein